MNLFQMLAIDPCEGNLGIVVNAVKSIFTLIQWAIPAVLIVMGTIDMFKAMASGDEKKTKEAQKTFIRRLIYAVVAFLIPFIIGLVFTFVGNLLEGAPGAGKANSTLTDFLSCWDVDSADNDPTGYCECEGSDVKTTSKSACDTASGHCTFTEK